MTDTIKVHNAETHCLLHGTYISTSDLDRAALEAAIEALTISANLHWKDSENPSLSDNTRNDAAECAVSKQSAIAHLTALLGVATQEK